jgi:hypothetical protein
VFKGKENMNFSRNVAQGKLVLTQVYDTTEMDGNTFAIPIEDGVNFKGEQLSAVNIKSRPKDCSLGGGYHSLVYYKAVKIELYKWTIPSKSFLRYQDYQDNKGNREWNNE